MAVLRGKGMASVTRKVACGVRLWSVIKGAPENPALSFAVMPTKHAYIGCDKGYRPPFVISKLR
jgi:hypothetical protein